MKISYFFLVILFFGGFFWNTSFFAQQPTPEKEPPFFALLVGIGKYPNLAPEHQLEGSINDVELIQEMLRKRFAVPQENITMLRDEQATRKGILDQFEALTQKVKNAGPETQVLFFYSGHGSQKKDESGDEEDGLDETLVAHNGNIEKGEENILDDEIEFFLQNLSALEAYTTVIFDCCHSGTALRGNKKVRSVPNPNYARRGSIYVSETRALPGKVVFFSACLPFEETEERFQPTINKTCGLLTYYLIQAIEQEGEYPTYRSIFKRLQNIYKTDVVPYFENKGESAPSPTIEGDISRILFGRKAIKGPKYAKVTEIFQEENKVLLDNGLFLDITLGSIFCLVPSIEDILSKEKQENTHLLVVIEQVHPFQSVARPLTLEERKSFSEMIPERFLKEGEPFEAVQEGWDCIELVHVSNTNPMRLYLEKEEIQQQENTKRFQRTPFAQEKLPASIQNTLSKWEKQNLLKIVSEKSKADVLLKIGQKKGVFLWANAEETNVPKEVSIEDYEPLGFEAFELTEKSNSTLSLEKAFEQFSKIRNLLNLQVVEENFSVEVSLVKIKKDTQKKWVADHEIKPNQEGFIEIESGELFGFLFINQSEQALYPNFIYIANDLQVIVLYPGREQTDYKVFPGDSKLVPVKATHSSFVLGKDTLKLIVTEVPIQLHALEMSSLEYASQKTRNGNKKTREDYFLDQIFKSTDMLSRAKKRNSEMLLEETPPQWSLKTRTWKIIKSK